MTASIVNPLCRPICLQKETTRNQVFQFYCSCLLFRASTDLHVDVAVLVSSYVFHIVFDSCEGGVLPSHMAGPPDGVHVATAAINMEIKCGHYNIYMHIYVAKLKNETMHWHVFVLQPQTR